LKRQLQIHHPKNGICIEEFDLHFKITLPQKILIKTHSKYFDVNVESLMLI